VKINYSDAEKRILSSQNNLKTIFKFPDVLTDNELNTNTFSVLPQIEESFESNYNFRRGKIFRFPNENDYKNYNSEEVTSNYNKGLNYFFPSRTGTGEFLLDIENE